MAIYKNMVSVLVSLKAYSIKAHLVAYCFSGLEQRVEHALSEVQSHLEEKNTRKWCHKENQT